MDRISVSDIKRIASEKRNVSKPSKLLLYISVVMIKLMIEVMIASQFNERSVPSHVRPASAKGEKRPPDK
jgi:hypothetical protein